MCKDTAVSYTEILCNICGGHVFESWISFDINKMAIVDGQR